MKYRALIGRSESFVTFCMECSGCGFNLRDFTEAIRQGKLKHCPNCGRKLIQRSLKIGNDVIVEMLNATDFIRESRAAIGEDAP